MATLRKSVFGGPSMHLDASVYFDKISNQITAATSPSVGDLIGLVTDGNGSDEGFYGSFEVPQNYVGTPKFIVKYILDGAPSASDVVGFAARVRAVADNEAADGTFDAEVTGSSTVGSSGENYANEDLVEESITISSTLAAGDTVLFWGYNDSVTTTYAGNCIIVDWLFEYADA